MAQARSAASISRWGAACASCAKAKVKCLRSNEAPGSKCDRCQSLEKDCTEQVHKPRKKRRSKSLKTAQLEEKLNTVVDLLKASAEIPSVLAGRSTETTGSQYRQVVSRKTPDQFQSSEHNLTLNYVPFTHNSSVPPTCFCRAPVSKEDLRPADSDENLLWIYVNQLCSWFPFVIISPGTTAAQLQETRPFLMKVIRLVASVRSLRSMWGQRPCIMRYISETVLMESERSLDLLQGILVLLGYYHYHCLVHTQFNSLTQLAISIIGDMGLNTKELRTRVLLMNSEEPKVRTNDERRAVVGVWYMSSNAAALSFTEPARYTKYFDQCLVELEEAAEYETDELLVHMVRIQHLTQRIFQINNRDQRVDKLPGIPRVPAAAYHTAFQTELARLRSSLPSKLRSNYLITNHFNTAQLQLYESLINDASLQDTVSQPFTSLSLSGTSTLDMFYRYNSALRTWFESWLAIPVCSYFYMPQPVWGQLIYSIRVLSRWAKLSLCKIQPAYASIAQDQLITSHQPALYLDPSERRSIGTPEPSNLGQPQNLASLTAVRAQVSLQPELQIDILGILEAMVVRFEIAEKEMSVAQGLSWKNEIWDLVAEKLKTKRVMVEKWWEIVAKVGGEGVSFRKYQPADRSDGGEDESGVAAGNATAAWFEPPVRDGNDQDNWQWASDLFDGMYIDHLSFFDGPGDWTPDWE
ncbi:hypothetical protein V1508DRAFT_424967 [Lipomyces doorenjongii]|uniref:uncharacterized protein n=1 Tax=Lipomyces doorenjongii TaxID=383834 RepID=UPI0034CDAF21